MDATFSFACDKSSAPLSKKRRFAPASSQPFTSTFSQTMVYDHAIGDAQPLLQQTDSQRPTQEDIERELLQVGMRVRKAISEGYKTTAFTPRPFFNMGRLSPETQAALCTSTMNKQPLSTATFCGLNLAALAHTNFTPTEEQEQRSWTYTSTHKRGYEGGDSDSDDQDAFMPHTPTLGVDEDMLSIPVDYFNIDFDDIDSENVSPLTQPSELVGAIPRRLPSRKFAVPKSRRVDVGVEQQQQQACILRNPFAPVHLNGTQWMGHRRGESCGVEAKRAFDFGEAAFLQRREDVDMEWS